MHSIKASTELFPFFSACPKLQKKPLVKLPADCVDRCSSDGDCAEGELCCDTSCGGRACLDPEAKPAKYRSDNGGAAKCQVADKYMQCVYDSIKNQVRRFSLIFMRRKSNPLFFAGVPLQLGNIHEALKIFSR